MDEAIGEDGARLAAWVERTLGGTVTRVEPIARWRPAWDLDVEVDGRVLPLHARGDREPRIAMPNRIRPDGTWAGCFLGWIFSVLNATTIP